MQHESSELCPPRRVHLRLPAKVALCVHLPVLRLRPLCTCRLTCTAAVQASRQSATDQEVTSTLRDMHKQVSCVPRCSICWLHCHSTCAHCPECVVMLAVLVHLHCGRRAARLGPGLVAKHVSVQVSSDGHLRSGPVLCS